MKKILSLALAVMMLVSAVPMVYAAENETDYTNGTTITLNGSGAEAYTVTVPATMSPGDTGTVKAEGTWAADKFLNVGVPASVTLSYGAQTMDVAITGGKFSLIGNSVDPVSREVEISVEDASRLFGTWTGVLEYDVALINKGDVNRDGVIDTNDSDAIRRHMLDTESADYKELTAEEQIYADVNGDGYIDSVDVTKITQAVNGLYCGGAVNAAPAQSE